MMKCFVLLCLLSSCSSFVNLREQCRFRPRSALVDKPRQQQQSRPTTSQCMVTAEKEKKASWTPVVSQDDYDSVNGLLKSKQHANNKKVKKPASDDLVDLMIEINSRITNGTDTVLQNLTADVGDEMVGYIVEMAEQIRVAQEKELKNQLSELDRKLREPLENLAFSDVPVFQPQSSSSKKAKKKSGPVEDDFPSRDELVLIGANSTLGVTRRMRSKEIFQNFNVAPFYYSVALTIRWARKASYPSIYLLSTFKWMSNLIKSNGSKSSQKRRRKSRGIIMDGDNLQAGWKRTGEIAAKGPIARRWAILRRSAEIWAYFSSFYLKDRRITAKFMSGQWTEERYKEERSKLGAEVKQNLLKLGPTFIKGK